MAKQLIKNKKLIRLVKREGWLVNINVLGPKSFSSNSWTGKLVIIQKTFLDKVYY